MNKKCLISIAMFFLTLSITHVLAYEANIEVSLSDSNVFYNATEIMFTDSTGKPCESFIYNGITYVPLRSVVQTLGKEVTWDAEEKSVYITDGNGESGLNSDKNSIAGGEYTSKNIDVWLSEINIFYNGEKIDFFDVNGNLCDIFIYNGITYTPLRSLCEVMGYDVYWNTEAKEAHIEFKGIIKNITLYTTDYSVSSKSADDISISNTEHESNVRSFEEFDKDIFQYTVNIGYFEPIPMIDVKTELPYDISITQWAPDLSEYHIRILNGAKEIAIYTINFERTPFKDFLKEFFEIQTENVAEFNAVWEKSDETPEIKVNCKKVSDNVYEWDVKGYFKKENYDLTFAYERAVLKEKIDTINIQLPPYNVIVIESDTGNETGVYSRGDNNPAYKSVRLDFNTEKNEQTMLIDCFSPMPVIETKAIYPYYTKVTQPTMETHKVVIEVYGPNNEYEEYVINVKRTSVYGFFERTGGGVRTTADIIENSDRISVVWLEDGSFWFLKDGNGDWYAKVFMSSEKDNENVLIDKSYFKNENDISFDYDLTVIR